MSSSSAGAPDGALGPSRGLINVDAGSTVPEPGKSGSKEVAEVAVPWANEVFYYTVMAVDEVLKFKSRII